MNNQEKWLAKAKERVEGKPLAPLPFIDMSGWDYTRPPARQWWVDQRIPLRQPTLISGEGAIGKSILVLQLLVATALEVRWLDIYEPEPGPVIYLGAEDDADEIHRRLAEILDYHGRRFSDLIKAGFKVLAYAGKDAVLAQFNRNGRIEPTELYERLYREACTLRPKGIVLDTVSDVFLGDEIKRDQVRQFGSLMRKLAIDAETGVVITSHPSLTGMKSGSGLSGSTGWHNSMRARAYFKRPSSGGDEAGDDDGGQQADDGRRELQFLKNQYGPLGSTITLKWTNGLWLPMSADAVAQVSVEDLFLKLLRRFIEQGRNVSENKSSTYAPAKFVEQPEAKDAKVSTKVLADAMERLLAAGTVKSVSEGPPSRPRYKLILGDEPPRATAVRPPSDRVATASDPLAATPPIPPLRSEGRKGAVGRRPDLPTGEAAETESEQGQRRPAALDDAALGTLALRYLSVGYDAEGRVRDLQKADADLRASLADIGVPPERIEVEFERVLHVVASDPNPGPRPDQNKTVDPATLIG